MAEVVLTVPSENGRHRALVVKLSDKLYRVEVEQLIESYDAFDCYRGNYWSPMSNWWTYTDSLNRAVELAAENLRDAVALFG